jgi:hypothetical protein
MSDVLDWLVTVSVAAWCLYATLPNPGVRGTVRR